MVWKEERGCSLSEGLELGSYWRDNARFCLSRSGVRIEPGFTHTEMMVEFMSRVEVASEANFSETTQH